MLKFNVCMKMLPKMNLIVVLLLAWSSCRILVFVALKSYCQLSGARMLRLKQNSCCQLLVQPSLPSSSTFALDLRKPWPSFRWPLSGQAIIHLLLIHGSVRWINCTDGHSVLCTGVYLYPLHFIWVRCLSVEAKLTGSLRARDNQNRQTI